MLRSCIPLITRNATRPVIRNVKQQQVKPSRAIPCLVAIKSYMAVQRGRGDPRRVDPSLGRVRPTNGCPARLGSNVPVRFAHMFLPGGPVRTTLIAPAALNLLS